MTKLNLHLHSRYSDGLFTPKQILAEAEKRDFSFISITDHNEIRGTIEASRITGNVVNIPGIELFFLYGTKLTEILVYFPTCQEIIGFYNEFIGHKIIPKVKNPEDLDRLIKKYHGIAIKPHPLHYKGAFINNFALPTSLIETENGMVKSKFKELYSSSFGGADLHSDIEGLECYSTTEDIHNIEEFFNNKGAKYKAVNNYKLTHSKKALAKIINTFMVPKYVIMQIIERKILKKPLLSERL